MEATVVDQVKDLLTMYISRIYGSLLSILFFFRVEAAEVVFPNGKSYTFPVST